MFETTVTPENEALLRSFHPSLEGVDSVDVLEIRDRPPIWVISARPHAQPLSTHVGGRELHWWPELEVPPNGPRPGVLHDPVLHDINCRRLLSFEDLERIRAAFPAAVGVRVLITGFVVVLFKDRKSMERSWFENGVSDYIGSLWSGYAIANHQPSGCQTVAYGQAVSKERTHMGLDVVLLGLKLRMRSGEMAGREVITTVTHGFVKLELTQNPIRLRLADWYARVRRSLAKSVSPKPIVDHPAIIATREKLGNSPLMKEVWLAGTDIRVGTIEATYDPVISDRRPFPSGFRHDLSLIVGAPLPRMTNPPNLPLIDGWASYCDVLDGGRVFLCRMNVQTRGWRVLEGQSMSTEAQTALILGSEYTWDRESRTQNVALLWRTEWDHESVQGASGSVLCLGRPTDSVAKAVVFQNYEGLLRPEDVRNDYRPEVTQAQPARFKGGFLLPREIREAEIILDNGDTSANAFNSLRFPPRTSADSKRVVTGPYTFSLQLDQAL